MLKWFFITFNYTGITGVKLVFCVFLTVTRWAKPYHIQWFTIIFVVTLRSTHPPAVFALARSNNLAGSYVAVQFGASIIFVVIDYLIHPLSWYVKEFTYFSLCKSVGLESLKSKRFVQ